MFSTHFKKQFLFSLSQRTTHIRSWKYLEQENKNMTKYSERQKKTIIVKIKQNC